MARAYGSCAAAKLVRRQTPAANGFFPVLTIHRDDLREYVSKKEIAHLSDDDMRLIADKLADALLNDVYWISLREIVKDLRVSCPRCPEA